MAEVTETALPGVGVRYAYTTDRGIEVGVIVHRDGRRELVAYDEENPDTCTTLLELSASDTRTVAEMLGASRVSEVSRAVQHEMEGLAIDWIRIESNASSIGTSIAEQAIRTQTGVSIVSVIRGTENFPAPRPEFVFEDGDIAVAVGTTEDLTRARALLEAD